MPLPKDNNLAKPYTGFISLKQVIAYDVISFITGIMYLFVISCLLVVIISVVMFGAPPPRESPEEIIIGLLCITGAAFVVIRFRTSTLTNILKQGEIVNAEVLRGFHYQFFVNINVRYSVQDKTIQKTLWLPNNKKTRVLINEEHLVISVNTDKPRKPVIRNLYLR